MARHRHPTPSPVDDEVVPFRLPRDGVANCGFQRRVGLAAAQDGPEVGRVLLAETHIESTGAGEANAVAALAEIMGKRRDESQPSARLSDRIVSGGTARAIVAIVKGP